MANKAATGPSEEDRLGMEMVQEVQLAEGGEKLSDEKALEAWWGLSEFERRMLVKQYKRISN